MTGILLLGLGFAYAMYYIMMISLSMELIPQGRAGLFDGLVSLGAGVGAFFGPFLAFNLNYLPTFIIAATIFLVAYLTLKALH
jgi:MFS family permease